MLTPEKTHKSAHYTHSLSQRTTTLKMPHGNMDVRTYPYSNLLTFTHLDTKVFSDMQFRPTCLCHSLYLHIVSLAYGEYVNMAGPADFI